MTSLRDALVGDDAAAGEAALELLGLGPGLTPAGDDILCGCLAGLRLLGRRAGHSWDIDLEAFGASIVASARDRTTTLSRTLLARAAAGVVVEPLLAVLLSLGGDGAIGGLDALLSIGHSSGRDMLAGASLAAQVILEREGFSGAAVAAPA
jgi:hypothetical protein